MTTNMRYGNKWTVNELLSLQREYELLEWSVEQIAEKHRRSVNAILFKLESEGFIASWNEARGFSLDDASEDSNQDSNEALHFVLDLSETSETDESLEYVNEINHNCDLNVVNEALNADPINCLSERVWNLEASVSEIGAMIKQIFAVVVSPKTSTRTASL